MSDPNYPHQAIIKIGYAAYQRTSDGGVLPSAKKGGSITFAIDGDNLDECLRKVRDWAVSHDLGNLINEQKTI